MTNYNTSYKRKCKCYEQNPSSHMFNLAKHRAAARGLDFIITKSDIEDVLPEDMICPVLGTKMTYLTGDSRTSPSLDRKDNTKGYTPGNIWVISNSANSMKRSKPLDEFLLSLSNVVFEDHNYDD